MIQRRSQPGSARAAPLQQMKGHALGRFLANTRQASQGFHQFINQGAECHDYSSKNRWQAGSERHLETGRHPHARHHAGHFVFLVCFYPANRIVHGGSQQVFQNFLVF